MWRQRPLLPEKYVAATGLLWIQFSNNSYCWKIQSLQIQYQMIDIPLSDVPKQDRCTHPHTFAPLVLYKTLMSKTRGGKERAFYKFSWCVKQESSGTFALVFLFLFSCFTVDANIRYLINAWHKITDIISQLNRNIDINCLHKRYIILTY